jgi:hypothetical protein
MYEKQKLYKLFSSHQFDGIKERRPPGAGIELELGGEKVRIAAYTLVRACKVTQQITRRKLVPMCINVAAFHNSSSHVTVVITMCRVTNRLIGFLKNGLNQFFGSCPYETSLVNPDELPKKLPKDEIYNTMIDKAFRKRKLILNTFLHYI